MSDEQLFTSHGQVKPTNLSSHKRKAITGLARPRVCAMPGCINPRRQAQAAKYCEEHATSINYVINKAGVKVFGSAPRPCLVCDADVLVNARLARDADAQQRRALALCPRHAGLAGLARQARKHHAPDDVMIRWLRNPVCDLDGEPVSFKAIGRSGTSGPVIDHDHSCCREEYSCGRCIRGLLHGRCNLIVGQVEEAERLAGSIEALTSYLRRRAR